jgi:hypothetical protein
MNKKLFNAIRLLMDKLSPSDRQAIDKQTIF